MKALQVLSNFTILADNTEEYQNDLMGIMRCYCEIESVVEYVDNYKITPESFWKGMNRLSDESVDFIEILKANVKEEIPEAVLTLMLEWKEKFGKVTLVGDDCLFVKDSDLMKELINSTTLEENLYDSEENLLFFKNIEVSKLQEIFQYEFNFPIKYHQSKIKTFKIEDSFKTIVVKSWDALSAFKSLYNVHPLINEEDLREKINHKKEEVSKEDINKYLELLYNDRSLCRSQITIKAIPTQTIFKPMFI